MRFGPARPRGARRARGIRRSARPDCRRWRTCRATALSRLRARAPAAPDRARGRVRRAVRARESARAGRAAHRPVRGARAGHQPPQGAGSAVRARRRSGPGGGHASTPAPPAPSGAFTASATSCSSTSAARAGSNPLDCPGRGAGSAGVDLAAGDRREHPRLPRQPRRPRGRRLVHHEPRGCGPGERARRARRRAHQSLRCLLRDARRAAVPAPLSAAHARADPRRRRAAELAPRRRRWRSMRKRRCSDILARCGDGCALPRARSVILRRTTAPCEPHSARHALPVKLADPASGAARSAEFGAEALASVLRLSSYASEYAALLPLCCTRPRHARTTRRSPRNCCCSSVPTRASSPPACTTAWCAPRTCRSSTRSASTERSSRRPTSVRCSFEGLQIVCRVWPHGPVDADLHAPLTSQVPALLLSGSDDPVTPPAWGAQALRSFPAGVGVVLEGFGHGQLTAPCVDRLMAQFLERASARGLDVGCTRLARPMPFFTSLNGPPP